MRKSPETAVRTRARGLHRDLSVALSAALLTLALPALAAAAGLDLTLAVEKVPLPAATLPISVRAEPIASRVVLETKDANALARHLRASAHTLCPDVGVAGNEVILRCRSRDIAAGLVPFPGGQTLEVRHLQVPPWSGRDGSPLVPFDPHKLDLGSHCPGEGNAAKAECALACGHPEEAEEPFREALGGPHGDLAALRLGDLAVQAGDLAGAVAMWKRVSPSSHFGRLAGARLCEVDVHCLESPRAEALFSPGDAEPPLRSDLLLRQARMDAFRGRALEAAQALAGEQGPSGACSAEPILCSDILLAALREPGGRGAQALGLYLETPSRDRGPLAVELARAASDRAAAAGAPVFAANLLSNVSGEVPAPLLSDHLARAAELYLSGGDRARATVLIDFARSRLPKPEMASARWVRIARAAVGRPAASAPAGADLAGAEADVRAARKALAAAPTSATGGKP
ncbi:MAG TPA: hypothetical protein VMK42_17090 [Anaeromyxobacteraceae bacterium]|nr:hypothetical protein [Anaeromyxobacteraceae bacterium]